MKIRKGFIVAAAASVTLIFATPSAWAGSPQQHRWEGVAIGVGAAILGSALIHHSATHLCLPGCTVHSYRAPFRHYHPEVRHPAPWKPYYGAPHRHWKRYHHGPGVYPGDPHHGRMAPRDGYRQPGNRSLFNDRNKPQGHGPVPGNHHKDRRY